VATADGSLPGSGMRTPFTRPPRNRSWRPSSQSARHSPNKAACAHEPGGGDKGVRSDRILHTRRKKTPSRRRRCGRRSGKRAVKRDSPQSRLAPEGPEPTGAFSGRLRAFEGEGGRDATLDGHGAERLRNVGDGWARSARFSHGPIAALGSDESTSARVGNGFGVQKSIGRIVGRDARGRSQGAPRTRAA